MTKMLLSILILFLACILILSGILLYYSPGKPDPFPDTKGQPLKGSISEKIFVSIGGIKQGMFIRGRNIQNPVLLYVHGGPAFPNYFLIDKYKPGLEDIFTVCYWEQRGGGLSYTPGMDPATITMQQLKSDAVEVTKYLQKRFGQEKIYLMAHSGGTAFAIQAVAEAPELFRAYIGMAQITNQIESEKLAYDYLLKEYAAVNDRKSLRELEKYPVNDSAIHVIAFYKSMFRDKAMHEKGIGTMRNLRSVFFDIFVPVWTCRAYTIKEKINIWVSKFSFVKKTPLIDELFLINMPSEIPQLDLPVYFFSGRYDLTVNLELSRAYLNRLKAPVKGFYTFEESAHSPVYEQPDKLRDILVSDVLNLCTGMADAP